MLVIPVSDVDQAKRFYANLEWRLDADFPFDNGFRVVQFTPPGSGCSVPFGTIITSSAPGSAQGLYLIVSHSEARRTCRSRRQYQRGVSRRNAGRAVPARRHERPPQRARAGSCRLPLVCRVQRPGRQQVAVAGGHNPAAWAHRFRRDFLRFGGRSGRARSGVRRRPMASTRSAPGSATRTGPSGTPRTWWRSRPAKSCRNERTFNKGDQA
jgi:catechol 2,3-dioxygenase-like lactoylglutathione lyase family enzyme